ncbi:MAG: circadian clock KaiB family protein [Thermomonas sp.]
MSRRTIYKFRLYVAGDGPNSSQARANLAALCRDHLPERYQIEIIDVINEPERALADRIFMTPTLVKLAPAPVRTLVGTLSDRQVVLQSLGMDPLSM